MQCEKQRKTPRSYCRPRVETTRLDGGTRTHKRRATKIRGVLLRDGPRSRDVLFRAHTKYNVLDFGASFSLSATVRGHWNEKDVCSLSFVLGTGPLDVSSRAKKKTNTGCSNTS